MILELELSLYKKLTLKNIRHFKWTLKESVQIILGTNGSGKSALLEELSPLPADKDLYYAGGKKRIVIAHMGKQYELISDFTKGQNHYFYCDGENLNPGRTVSIQKKLVYEHFNITQERHNVLLGREKFTAMKPPRRKEFLMQICVVDYTFAIKLYKRIQSELNAMSVGIRLAKDRLGKEVVLTVGEEELAQMRSRLAELTKESQEMYLAKNARALTIDQSSNNLKNAVSAINELKVRFSTIRKTVKGAAYISLEEYQSTIDDTKSQLTSAQTLYERLSNDFIKLGSELGNTEDLVGEDATVVKDSVIADKKQVEVLLGRRKNPLEGLNAIAASGSMELVYESLVTLLTEIPSDPDNKLNSEALRTTNEELILLKGSLVANEEKLADVEHREKHLANLSTGDNIACPKCTHEWKVGYSLETHNALLVRVSKGRDIIAGLKNSIVEAETRQLQLVNYSALYKEYIRITKNTPELLPLWEQINANNSLKTSPQHTLSLVELTRNDLFIGLQVSSIEDKIKSNLQRLKLIEYAQSLNIKEIKAKQDALELELGFISNNKVLLQRQLASLQQQYLQVKNLHDIAEQIKKAQSALDQQSYAVVEAIKNDVIDQALVTTHSEIAMLSTRINSIESQASVIRELNNTIASYEQQHKAYKLLSDTLSPTDGLIAEGMLGFIRNYISRMNAVIAKVWTYRMEVFDCSTEKDSAELDYKFPLSIPNLVEPVPDINCASSGQKEMIDLAAMVISAQCMRLDYGPLFLDEFGKTFDKTHQNAATHVVSQLMEQLNFSQLFMISHYESCYGTFFNAQFTVLDARNITIPESKKVNQFVEITA